MPGFRPAAVPGALVAAAVEAPVLVVPAVLAAVVAAAERHFPPTVRLTTYLSEEQAVSAAAAEAVVKVQGAARAALAPATAPTVSLLLRVAQASLQALAAAVWARAAACLSRPAAI